MTKEPDNNELVRTNLRPPTQSRSRESTLALLAIGRSLIEERGIDGTSMNDVAAAADSSVGTLYFRFGSKERFVSEVIQRHNDETRERLERFVARTTANAKSAAEVIDAFVHWIVAGYIRHGGLLRAQMRHAVDHPETWPSFRAAGQAITEGMIRAIERFPEATDQTDWRRRVRFAMQMILGTLNNALINQPGPLHLTDAEMSTELSRAAVLYLGWEPQSEAMPIGSRPNETKQVNRASAAGARVRTRQSTGGRFK